MPVITATVREAIATDLAEKTEIEIEEGDSLVRRVASDPRLMLAMPETFPELKAYFEQLGAVLADREFPAETNRGSSNLGEVFIGAVAHAPFDRYELSTAQRTELHEAGLDGLAAADTSASDPATPIEPTPESDPKSFEGIAVPGLNTRVNELDEANAITASEIRDIIEEAELSRHQLEALQTYLQDELADLDDE